MASVTLPDDQPAPPVPLMARLTAPRTLLILGALTWVPLVAYVMFGASRLVLLPAIPAVLILYCARHDQLAGEHGGADRRRRWSASGSSSPSRCRSCR